MGLIKENNFSFKKPEIRQYTSETKIDIDYTDDLALLANTPILLECLLHILEQPDNHIDRVFQTRSIPLHNKCQTFEIKRQVYIPC